MKRITRTAVAAALLGLVAAILQFGPAAGATSASCADAVTSAPTGPATVSTASSAYGKVLVVGSGDHAGCSLYLLTSDQLHALTGSRYACSNGPNATGAPCDTVLWPALLTKGAPVAGPGVKSSLLGTVTRTDLPSLGPVQQVTYNGQPLYRFVFDEDPGETEGANLFDPVTSPTGTWYLVEPDRGNPAPGKALMRLETAPVGGTGPNATVLAARMNNDFVSLFADASFPVYTQSPGHGHEGPEHGGPHHGGTCQMLCAQYWPPVLTSGQPVAGSGVDQHALGTVMRPDGTQQVTYRGKPVYLFADDAYLPPFPYNGAAAGIYGAGADTLWGEFNTIPPLH